MAEASLGQHLPGALIAGGQAPAAISSGAGGQAPATIAGVAGADASATPTPTPVAGTPTPTATSTPVPQPTKLLYDWYFKRPTEKPTLCGPYDCADSAPNTATQYISGHVMDRTGTPVQGIIVDAKWNGQISYSTTDANGQFNILIATSCPSDARTYDVYIVDDFQELSSYVKEIHYDGNCAKAGEFHFDFIEVS